MVLLAKSSVGWSSSTFVVVEHGASVVDSRPRNVSMGVLLVVVVLVRPASCCCLEIDEFMVPALPWRRVIRLPAECNEGPRRPDADCSSIEE